MPKSTRRRGVSDVPAKQQREAPSRLSVGRSSRLTHELLQYLEPDTTIDAVWAVVAEYEQTAWSACRSFRLVHGKGMSQASVARRFDISEAAVSKHLKQVRERVRATLKVA
jgi:DNA-directed RNA polymerase specialized sigma24 family protein